MNDIKANIAGKKSEDLDREYLATLTEEERQNVLHERELDVRREHIREVYLEEYPRELIPEGHGPDHFQFEEYLQEIISMAIEQNLDDDEIRAAAMEDAKNEKAE